jgi:hypothetical protein
VRSRAFIVAIQNYQHMVEGLGPPLQGTHEHAERFRRWLIDEQGVEEGHIRLCADAEVPGRTADATSKAIRDELRQLQKDGKDQTDALFFYFSGHGFSFVDIDDAPVTDVLLGADYVDRESGDACLRLSEIQKWLYMCLGPGDHYYFIEACRNRLTERDIRPALLGLTYTNKSNLERPTVHTLFSAPEGDLTVVSQQFSEALLDGLRGKGRAKQWFDGSLSVVFDSVRAYLEKRLGTSLDPQKNGSRPGIIKQFPPPGPQYTCTISVDGAEANDTFNVAVLNRHSQQLQSFAFQGAVATFSQKPEDYYVQVSAVPGTSGMVGPRDPVFADLYDPCELKFTLVAVDGQEAVLFTGDERAVAEGTSRGRGVSTPSLPLIELNIEPPHGGAVRIESLQRGESVEVRQPTQHHVPPARYAIVTVDDRGVAVHREERTLEEADSPITIDRRRFKTGAVRQSIVSAFPHQDGAVYMSETLGPMVDQGLDLWLAVVGASRIIGPNRFRKLGPLPLERFEDVQPGDAPIYVLAGFDEPGMSLAIAISPGWDAAPAPARPHSQFDGLFEVVERKTGAGYSYVTVQAGSRPPVTFGAYTLPDRATLVTVTLDERGAISVQQFILPLGKLADADASPPLTTHGEMAEPLRVVRRAVEMQRAFAAGKPLTAALPAGQLEELLRFKWFEPIVAVLAAYELVRRGERGWMPEVLTNLHHFFPALGDLQALARMNGDEASPPATPPLVMEGYEVLDFTTTAPAPPSERLLFRGPWTMWRGKG